MISVIIPNYNNSKYLDKCIESVLNQSYKNIELIIVDDGSSDDSVNIIKKYLKNKKNNIIFYEQNNLNAAIARNKGIELSKGDYLFFLDSDDYLYSNDVLEKLVNVIKNNDLVIGNYDIIDENDKFIKEYIVNNDNNLIDIDNSYKYSMISPVPSNKLYKRSIIEKYNIFFSNIRIGQDLNFYLKYLACSNNINIIDDKIYNYRVVETGISKTINNNIFDIVKCFEEVKKFYILNNKEDLYDKFISLVQLKNYHVQMKKYINVKDKSFRKSILLFFKYYYNKIDISKVYDKNKLDKYNKLIRKKILLYPIITTDIYYNFKNRRK